MDLQKLREKRNKAIADARAVLDKADSEKRSLTAEEVESQGRMLADAKSLGVQLRQAEELEIEERGIIPESQREEPKTRAEVTAFETRRKAFATVLTRSDANIPQAELTESLKTIGAVHSAGQLFPARKDSFILMPTEQRSNNTLTLAAGGAAVAPDTSMYGRILEALKFYGGMEAVGSEIMTTETGADLPMATDDDTANVGAIVAEEGSHDNGTSPTMGVKTLHAYLYSSLIVKVSWQLLQDASFDIETYLGRKLGMRLGRIQNTHYTTGTGTSQPQGLVTAATVGRQSATGNSTTVVADDVKRLIHSIDVAYRNPGCKFMMNDSTALAFELLKDGNGQYIWRSGSGLNSLNDGSSASLAGYGVVINNDMPTLAASAKHTSFGDHTFYKIRRVRAIQIVRLNELYAANGQVGFLAFMRADGGLIDAGQHPVKLLQNSAT